MEGIRGEKPVPPICHERNISVALYYEQSQAGSDKDLISAIEDVLKHPPFYDYRRVLKQLQRQGISFISS